MQPIKINFFGTPIFAADVLRGLHSDPLIQIKLVVTGKAKMRGRHTEVPTPVAVTVRELGLPVYETDQPNDPELLAQIRKAQPDLGVIVAWRILPEAIYSTPRMGTINLHGSLLPHYRGAAPIQRAIWNGESETGLTVFLLDRGIDTGNLLLAQTIPIGANETTGDIFQRFAPVGVDLLRTAIAGLVDGSLQPRPQPDITATPAPKIKKEERWIDWREPAECIRRHIHALSPEPGAVTLYGDIRVLLLRVKLLETLEIAEPGKIVVEKHGVRVASGKGWLEVVEIAREGKKTMSGAEFAQGIQQWNGGRFSNPIS